MSSTIETSDLHQEPETYLTSETGCIMHEETHEKPNGYGKLSSQSSNSLQNGAQFDVNVENEEL